MVCGKIRWGMRVVDSAEGRVCVDASQHRTRIEDVARACHVSTATVSRALNGKPGVSAKLKHLIIEYARIHDYHPDSAARSMRLRRSNTIILVSRMDPFKESIPLAQMGETGLEHFGTDLKHVSIPSDSDLIESLAALEAHRHPPLFVVFGPCLVDDPARFAAIHTPILFILSDDAPAGYLTVASDDRHGARMVTESLIAAGHRDIMVLTERRNDGLPYYQHRIDGFRDALVAHGIPFRPSSVYSVSVDYSDYFHSSRQEIMRCIIPLLTAHHGASRPTALLVLSDFLAFTTVKAL